MVESPPTARYLTEFIATYLVVLTVGCNIIAGSLVWVFTAYALVVVVLTYATGPSSGGNLNPAVSVALLLAGKVTPREACIYSAVQLAAGLAGALSYAILFGEAFTLGPSRGYGWWQAGLAELLYTFLLCFVVLNTATAKRHATDQFYGLAIGLVFIAGGYSAGHVSGGCFNPALAFGIDVTGAAVKFGWSIVYIIFELLGAVLAAVLYRIVRPDDYAPWAMPEGYSMRTRLIAEFVGTAFVVLTVGLAVLGRSPATPLAAGAVLISMTCALFSISGAHFNPCVTAALHVSGRGKLGAREAGVYVAVQFAAGVFAAVLYAIVEGGSTFSMSPGRGFGWINAGFAELLFTFLLCYVYLACATTASLPTQYLGLALGACLAVGGFAIGGISGGALNPALCLGASFVHLFKGGGLLGFFLYTGAELAGAALGAIAFMATHPYEYKLPAPV
jgi:aquaporin Z